MLKRKFSMLRISCGLIMTILSLMSCKKIVNLDLGKSASALVIEGNITDEPGPYYVKLTKTVNVDQPNVYPTVDGARLIITDNAGQRDTLTNAAAGLYKTNTLAGIPGRIYSLSVLAEGKAYMAQSTMPQNVFFDSLRYSPYLFAGTVENAVIPVFTDPPYLGNNYRFILEINGVTDKTYLVSNDNVNNGAANQLPLQSDDTDMESGDSVRVEMQCIDKTDYLYYFTLSQAVSAGPGGGTAPGNPPNGISGGALGLFSAHTTQKKLIVIP